MVGDGKGGTAIIFVPHHAEHLVEISAILLRDEQTYRRRLAIELRGAAESNSLH